MQQLGLSIFNMNITATAALVGSRFVTFAGAVPAANANVLGVVKNPGIIGDWIIVDVLGTAIVESGGAIAAGATIATDSQGRAVSWTAGAKIGLATQATTVAGQMVEVLLIPNVA